MGGTREEAHGGEGEEDGQEGRDDVGRGEAGLKERGEVLSELLAHSQPS